MLHVFRSAAAVTLTLVATAFAAQAQSAQAQSTMTPAPAAASSPAADASPAPSPIPTPVNPPENPLVTTRVRQEFTAWQDGHIDRKTYSPYAGGTYIDALVKIVEPDLAAIGTPQTVTYQTGSLLLGDLVYRYDVTGSSGTVSVLYWLDQQGRTDGIVFTPKIFVPPPTP